MPTTLRVGTPSIISSDGRAVWSAPVSHPKLPERLWYSIPEEHAPLLTERLDPALVALTVPALCLGAPLHLEGTVDDELLHHHHELQAVLLLAGMGTSPILVMAAESGISVRALGVATGFSAGVDSFATLAENHCAQGIPQSQRITHLLFNNLGSHYGTEAKAAGTSDSDAALEGHRNLWRARFRQAVQTAAPTGLPLIDVDANVHQFYLPDMPDFVNSHTFRNASVAHLLSRAIGTWLYSSGAHLRDIRIAGRRAGCAYYDPVSVPLLSSSAITMRTSGSAQSRVEKTALIAELHDAQVGLDVCVAATNEINCSRCFKCLRTLATLEILDAKDKFGARFDLAAWEQEKEGYFGKVLSSHRSDPYAAELLELAAERGYRLPSGAKSVALRLMARQKLRPVKRAVSRLVRRRSA